MRGIPRSQYETIYLKLEDYKKAFYPAINSKEHISNFQNNAIKIESREHLNQKSNFGNQNVSTNEKNIFEMDNFDIGNPLSNFNSSKTQIRPENSGFGQQLVLIFIFSNHTLN